MEASNIIRKLAPGNLLSEVYLGFDVVTYM